MTKAEIRRDMKQARSNIPEIERKEWDASIRRRLQQTEEYQCSKTLFCYVSFGSELDTGPIILQALQEGKIVYVPRVDEKHRMEFYRIHDLDSLQPSRFGVPEPSGEEEKRYQLEAAIHSHDNPLMLLPGLAFDLIGNRIGYGAGYYDRYLLEYNQNHFYKMALCYDFQLLEHIEAQEYDVGADAIITPTKRIKCK